MPDIEYDYAQVPTVWRFSQAHKFIRGLMGPFGSGKSSACVMEVVQWATLDTRAETPRTRRAIHRASSPMSRACAERKLRQAEASMQLTTVCAAGSAAYANAINSAPVDDVQENRLREGLEASLGATIRRSSLRMPFTMARAASCSRSPGCSSAVTSRKCTGSSSATGAELAQYGSFLR